MKAILEFNLPEDAEDHKLALNGIKYKIVLEDFGNWLRNRYKHTEAPSDSAFTEHEETRQAFWDLYKERLNDE